MTSGLLAFLFLFICVVENEPMRGNRQVRRAAFRIGRSAGFLRTQDRRKRFKRCGLVGAGRQNAQLRFPASPEGT
jgi:hypothetical protein